MNEYKEHKHLGVYGLIIKGNQILLINKVTGPYDGKLDLPGGSIEYSERPEDALKREFLEETGIKIKNYEIYNSDSVMVEWNYNGIKTRTHHIGIFYIIKEYQNEIKKDVNIDSQNDDSLGANFYDIKDLSKNMLSNIAILELEKLGYKISE